MHLLPFRRLIAQTPAKPVFLKAAVAQCERILQAVKKRRVLDCDRIHQTFLDEFVDKVHTY